MKGETNFLPVFFPELTEAQINLFNSLKILMAQWNEKINLISRKDFDQFDERHLLHSLSVGLFFKFRDGTKIIDVGSGGGFPGLPLAIMFPEVEFTIIDSIQKKMMVVRDVVEKLNLKNVTVTCSRAEDHLEKYDFVLGRAVATLPEFCKWTLHLLSKKSQNTFSNGVIYLKGGDLDEEIDKIKTLFPFFQIEVKNIAEFFPQPFFETKLVIYLHH